MRLISRLRNVLAPLALAAVVAPAASAAQLVATPSLAMYGQPVNVELRDTTAPAYLPATRFVRVGSIIVIDYEYAPNAFTAARLDFGTPSVALGELVPGNYVIEARLFSMDNPTAPPKVVTQSLAVAPPENWGIYLIPRAPEAFEPTDVLIRSAAYFEPGSMQVTTNGNVVRVSFDYRGDAPVGGRFRRARRRSPPPACPRSRPATTRSRAGDATSPPARPPSATSRGPSPSTQR
jgi:hypothetical protein